jgi:hypothetical protein
MTPDIAARIDALSALLDAMDEASGVEAFQSYAAIKTLCADLGAAAEDYASGNIAMILDTVEQHAAALAGLMPSWDLPREQHRAGARAAIHKLAMPTCFGRP